MVESSNPARSGYFRNWLTFFGVMMMLGALLGGGIVFVEEVLLGHSSPYSGILWAAACLFLILGFVLIPIGMLWERGRVRRGAARHRPLSVFTFDLNNPEHRNAAMVLVGGLVVVVVLTSVGSYESFRATESPEFCGELCHQVMHPEWVRYQASPHARVACADCHIGEGADWFVKSKLSGLRQVWAVAVDSYSRPIPTPIHNLRPARETCERCHWRRKFTGYKEMDRSYYLSGEDNPVEKLRMLVKIGGEKTSLMKGSGIHYHMLIANKVQYIAVDEKRQQIAWVRVERADGSVTEYNDRDHPLTDKERQTLEVRTMDCVDCHNRPSHKFPTAMYSVDEAMAAGRIAVSLPDIKVQAVSAIDTPYDTEQEALSGIDDHLRSYYKREYPEVFERKNADLTRSIEAVQDIYRRTVFPYMKADWHAYPSNIGHLESPGCFRCHNETLVSDTGEVIFKDCNSCHLILAQGANTNEVEVNIETGLPFVHPEDYSKIEEFTNCSDCHDGGAALYE